MTDPWRGSRPGGETIPGASRTVYDVPHDRPWGWKVSLYIWTKSIAAGAFLIPALGQGLHLLSEASPLVLTGTIISIVFLVITALLLLFDLKRPERFYRILLRPQWCSWLAIGTYILVAYALFLTLSGVLLGGPLLLSPIDRRPAALPTFPAPPVLLWIGAFLASLAAIYTGFLFGQAKGRDLWQSPLLPFHLLIQAGLAGCASLLLVPLLVELKFFPETLLAKGLLWSVIFNLLMILAGEVAMPHPTADGARAVHLMVAGPFRVPFWAGVVGIGHLLPLICLWLGGQPFTWLAALLSLFGLLVFEQVWLAAGQAVPLS